MAKQVSPRRMLIWCEQCAGYSAVKLGRQGRLNPVCTPTAMNKKKSATNLFGKRIDAAKTTYTRKTGATFGKLRKFLFKNTNEVNHPGRRYCMAQCGLQKLMEDRTLQNTVEQMEGRILKESIEFGRMVRQDTFLT